MNQSPVFSLKNTWFSTSVGVTVLFAALTALGGLVLLPYLRTDSVPRNIWDAICSAAGVPHVRSAATPVQPDFKLSDVVMTSGMLAHPSAISIGRGATLGQQCAICHGMNGVSRANTPNLAGQYAAAIYKELEDFKSGARGNAVMSPFAAALNEQDILDLAAFYSYLPRGSQSANGTDAPRIVMYGAPMRNIAPCAACHGGLDTKAGSPWLDGQSAVYIKAQLQAFAAAGRRNDISEQMRNVARNMTPTEMDEAANYFAGQP